MTEQSSALVFLLTDSSARARVTLSETNPMPNPEKAYKNLDFLNSKAARTIRILCEYEEPKARFEAEGVENTIVMFGSARIRSRKRSPETLEDAKAALADGSGSAEAVDTAEKRLRLSRYYEMSVDLSRRLTEWSEGRDGPDYHLLWRQPRNHGGGEPRCESGPRCEERRTWVFRSVQRPAPTNSTSRPWRSSFITFSCGSSGSCIWQRRSSSVRVVSERWMSSSRR